MQSILKTNIDDLKIEYDIILPDSNHNGLSEVNQRLDINDSRINELNVEIDRLTNRADMWDNIIAVGSGVIAGIIDSLWVGEFSLERGKEWGNDKANNFVVKVAQSQGYKGDDLEGAIRFLENKYCAPSDSNTPDFGGGLQHHLRDFAHHPTIVGLFFSLLTQFTKKSYGTDKNGVWKVVEVKDTTFIGNDVPQKVLYGVVYWFFHLISDMAGSSSTPGAGTGIPGPLLSFLKEISALPFFKKTNEEGVKEFSLWISKLFNGTLLGKRDSNGKLTEAVRFDLRAEIGVVYEIGRQTVPVVINECIVRGFYFIRSVVNEIKEKDVQSIKQLHKIDWKNTLPFKNRTIVRMLTISTSTFMVFDIADAAIRSAIKSGGDAASFGINFVLRVNFIGVGRCFVAVGTDVYMGIKKGKLRNERIAIMSEQLYLMNAKVFYKQGEMWTVAKDAVETIHEAEKAMKRSILFYNESVNVISSDLESIGENIPNIEKNNHNLTNDMLDTIKWG